MAKIITSLDITTHNNNGLFRSLLNWSRAFFHWISFLFFDIFVLVVLLFLPNYTQVQTRFSILCVNNFSGILLCWYLKANNNDTKKIVIYNKWCAHESIA